MKFQAYVTDGKGQLNRNLLDAQALGPTQVRVAVSAVGLNFRDSYFIRGNAYRPPVEGRIPATDAMGIVDAVGEDVTRFKVGDRVCSIVLPNWIDGPLTAQRLAGSIGSQERDGVLAQTIQMDEQELVAAPPHLSDIEAATLSVAALTAWHAVAELRALDKGDTVVVQTTGGVAVFAIQFAAALGMKPIVVSRSDDKLRRAVDLGAVAAINSTAFPDWDREVLALTDGLGARMVLDMGLTDSLRQSSRAAAFEGTVAVIGVVQERTNPLDIFTVMNKNLSVRGVETGSRAMFERMNRFLHAHGIKPVVDSVFAWNDIDAALDRLAAAPFGKIVIESNSART